MSCRLFPSCIAPEIPPEAIAHEPQQAQPDLIPEQTAVPISDDDAALSRPQANNARGARKTAITTVTSDRTETRTETKQTVQNDVVLIYSIDSRPLGDPRSCAGKDCQATDSC